MSGSAKFSTVCGTFSRYPLPPLTRSYPGEIPYNTAVLLLLIDYGTGNLKLNARFVTKTSSKRAAEIVRMAERNGVKATFNDLGRVVSPTLHGKDVIRRDATTVQGK